MGVLSRIAFNKKCDEYDVLGWSIKDKFDKFY